MMVALSLDKIEVEFREHIRQGNKAWHGECGVVTPTALPGYDAVHRTWSSSACIRELDQSRMCLQLARGPDRMHAEMDAVAAGRRSRFRT